MMVVDFQVRSLLAMRFGPQFAQSAIDNTDNKVSTRVLSKLGVEPPSPTLVTRYLREIARTYSIDWGNDSESVESDGDGGGIAALEPPLEAEFSTGDSTRREPIAMAPPSPTSENPHPAIKLPPNSIPPRKPSEPKPPQAPKPPSGGITEGVPKAPSLDDLMSRFEALKKR
jgi:vacuolar protein sorting-associated protein IST1